MNTTKKQRKTIEWERDLFKKIRDNKGKFHAKITTMKHRNGKDLAEAEDAKNRWQEYIEELYKKGLNDPELTTKMWFLT